MKSSHKRELPHDIGAERALIASLILNQNVFDRITDLKTISAVQHQILIIGEATKRLSSHFRNQHTHIPWKAMAGMRDVLIHSYDNADDLTPKNWTIQNLTLC